MTTAFDAASIAGKPPVVAERTQLLVLGGGPAGLAAALEGAQAGLSVVLVDEHPLDPALMGMDVPLHFGQRMDGSVRNRSAMLERIAATDKAIEEAFECGIDIRLATDVWGVFANGRDVRWLPGPVAGLAADGRSWLLGFDRIVIAAGRRDLGIAFPGWNLPGVMGATAAYALLQRYQAFNGTRVAVLGSGFEALSSALIALDRGIEVAAVLEVGPALRGPESLVAKLRQANVPLLVSMVPVAVDGTAEGVQALRLSGVDSQFRLIAGTGRSIACDTVILGVGAVPNVEAFDVLGCRLTHRAALGGYVPDIDAQMRTSIPFVFAAGDCTGVFDGKSLNPDVARTEGRTAALAAALSLGVIDQAEYVRRVAALDITQCAPLTTASAAEDWMTALMNAADDQLLVCQCEEVTRGDLLGVRPPRYLQCTATKVDARDLATLASDGPVNQDQVKRLTRAGMGSCQGRRCREQVAMMLARATGVSTAQIPVARYRPPLRPLPLSLLQEADEQSSIAAHWNVWFGIEGQWRPYWDLDPEDETAAGPAVYGK